MEGESTSKKEKEITCGRVVDRMRERERERERERGREGEREKMWTVKTKLKNSERRNVDCEKKELKNFGLSLNEQFGTLKWSTKGRGLFVNNFG